MKSVDDQLAEYLTQETKLATEEYVKKIRSHTDSFHKIAAIKSLGYRLVSLGEELNTIVHLNNQMKE